MNKVTIQSLLKQKSAGEKIPVMTASDYSIALIQVAAGAEVLLVGDSVGNTHLGEPNTLSVPLDFMITLCAAVRRAAPKVYLIGDMPFGPFQISDSRAIEAGCRFLAEGGCDAVKVECHAGHLDRVSAMADASIPVVAHLGLRPQSSALAGGYRICARTVAGAKDLIELAEKFEQAGAAMVLLELVPPEPAELIARRLRIPVIGCGAGPECDGHVMVLYDMIGLSSTPPPRFVKTYAQLGGMLKAGFSQYIEDVRTGRYPSVEHGYDMLDGEADQLKGEG